MKFIDRVDAVAKRLERFFTGGRPNDPLYVSNRSAGQKLRFALLLGTPALVIGIFIYLAMTNYFDPPVLPEKTVLTPKEPTGEITAKVLPHVSKDLAVSSEYSRDIEVLEASVSSSDHTLLGKVRNTTDHVVKIADLVFDVTDDEGSQLGGVAVRVENIQPRAIVPFKVTLEQRNARSALVREVHSR
jgi:hypothetical protein